jgi:DUF1365 family protein
MISHYSGVVWHKRVFPKIHEFNYGLNFLKLSYTLNDNPKKINYPKTNLWYLKLAPMDYLSGYQGNIVEKLKNCLSFHECEYSFTKLELFTLPKFLGVSFNPVNFWVLSNDDQEQVLIVEINNTFGEKHTYLYQGQLKEDPISIDKEFHVSPFNNLDGTYKVSVIKTDDTFRISIDLYRDGKVIFQSTLGLTEKTLSENFLKLFFQHSQNLFTTSKIGYQAAILYFKKKQTIYDHSEPKSKFTFKWKKPVFLQRLLTSKWM